MRMSDCVESGRGDDSRGVGAVKAQSMVDGTRGGMSAQARRMAPRRALWVAMRTDAWSSKRCALMSAMGVSSDGNCKRVRIARAKSCAGSTNAGDDGTAVTTAEA